MGKYMFENEWTLARRRLALLEESADPASIAWLHRLGVGPGWHCWDVGAGAGSVARWLGQQVGPSGTVLATDVDTRLLQENPPANVEVRSHNVVSDPLPPQQFDLVHTRLLLMHLPEREDVLHRLISALAPGGWILLEEHDVFPITALAGGAYAHVWSALVHAAHGAGASSEWGRRLPGLLSAQELVAVESEAMTPLFRGGSPNAEFWALSWQQTRERLIGGGLQTGDLDRAMSDLDDPAQWFVGPAMVAAWGQKPGRS